MTTIVTSFDIENTYFIFRDNGDKVSFTIKNGLVKPSKKLTAKEANYIRNQILKQ